MPRLTAFDHRLNNNSPRQLATGGVIRPSSRKCTVTRAAAHADLHSVFDALQLGRGESASSSLIFGLVVSFGFAVQPKTFYSY
jgi:hypothetical protein